MNGIENHHLSPEMIEDAVLRRLSPEQSAEVDSHLAGCARCREAYEQERLLAAGTRIWARTTMKKKLAKQIAAGSPRQIPWPHVLGAAALFVVIIGVGVLFHWKEPAPQDGLTFSDSTALMEAPSPAPPASAPATRFAETQAPQQHKAVASEERALPRREKMDESQEDRMISAAPSLAPEKDKEATIAEAPTPAAEATAGAGAARQEIWVGGSQVSDARSGYKQTHAVGASEQGVSLNRLESRKGARAAFVPSQVFIIDQDPVRQSTDLQMGIGDNATPTRLVQSGDTLYVTLYLDTLLTAVQLRAAFGRQISPDSFQVILPDRILGYRMPKSYTR